MPSVVPEPGIIYFQPEILLSAIHAIRPSVSTLF
jgi:hypothetical protein